MNKLFQQKLSFALYNLKVFTMKELLEKLENNSFIDKVRIDLEFDVKDYQELLKILDEIKHYTYNHNLIEKD